MSSGMEQARKARRASLVLTSVLVVLLPASAALEGAEVDSNEVDGTAAASSLNAAVAPSPAGMIDIVSLVPEVVASSAKVTPAPYLEFTDLDRSRTLPSGSTVLSDLEPELRENARISLEAFREPGLAQLLQAAGVEDLWNSGRHSEAIVALEDLEGSGGVFGVMISWRHPIAAPQKLWYEDARIGTRTGGADAALDYDPDTGNLLALIVWDLGWSMNISTDGGVSWAETYYWSGVWPAVADMAVSGDFAWVGYSTLADDYMTSRFRRFYASTGVSDSEYGNERVADESPNTITELVVQGNTPDIDSRIYMAYLVDETGGIHFWWDDLGGTSFSELSPGITNARSGLDMTWNPHASGSPRRWISYVGTDDDVSVWRSDGGGWNMEVDTAFDGSHRRTAISAYADHVYLAFEEEMEPNKTGVRYFFSDDAGDTAWHYYDAYRPSGDEVSGYTPDLSVRSGVGVAVVFSSETGEMDDAYFVTRRGWEHGSWSTPAWYNNHDHVSGEATYIVWMGTSCVASYGMLYFDGEGDHAPYFDLMTPRAFFCDGFEDGTINGWGAVTP